MSVDYADDDGARVDEFDLGTEFTAESEIVDGEVDRECTHCGDTYTTVLSMLDKIPPDSFFNWCPGCVDRFLAHDPEMSANHAAHFAG